MMTELIECKTCKNKADPIMKTCTSCGGAIVDTIDTIKPEKIANRLLLLSSSAFLIVLGVIVLYWWNFGSLSIDTKHWGEFGDYFGGTLNPILSFLSLIALLSTIVLQSKELELTRDELKRSADVQAATKEVLDKQSETLARQQFETTLSSLLEQHNRILDGLTSPISVGSISGFSGRTYYNQKAKVDDVKSHVFGQGDFGLEVAYYRLESMNFICGPYFRVLYQLLKFIAINSPNSSISKAFDADEIKNAEMSEHEKIYSNIVRSFLGYEITQLLAINCYCSGPDDINWRYKLLIERYAFLEHMPFSLNNTDRSSILEKTIDFYDPSAFGDSRFLKKT